jgi:hypothetical protein
VPLPAPGGPKSTIFSINSILILACKGKKKKESIESSPYRYLRYKSRQQF